MAAAMAGMALVMERAAAGSIDMGTGRVAERGRGGVGAGPMAMRRWIATQTAADRITAGRRLEASSSQRRR